MQPGRVVRDVSPVLLTAGHGAEIAVALRFPRDGKNNEESFPTRFVFRTQVTVICDIFIGSKEEQAWYGSLSSPLLAGLSDI